MGKYAKPLGESGIEWTNRTWNPVTGCTKISAGCKHCYAETLAKRLKAMSNPRYENGFELTLHRDKLDEPRSWRKPEWIFVNSMSDLLHKDVPDDFILGAFATMAATPRHRYQVLTKRPDRWASISEQVIARFGRWPSNVLPGTSVESKKVLPRLDALGKAGDSRTVRMVSVEPLLESLCDGAPEELAECLVRARMAG